MIRITNLRKRLSAAFTLQIPSLTIADGERVALIGPNGSGKSTLLRMLANVIPPDEGEIELSLPKEKIGYQPQSPYIFKGTVELNVRLGLHGNADPETCIRQCGLEALRSQKASMLSGGERQRLCLCRMLAGSYGLLLLDEPLSAADIETGEKLEKVLSDHCDSTGTGLVIATHLPKQALHIATKILILNRGEIAEYGSAEELRSPRSEFGQRFLSQWKWE